MENIWSEVRKWTAAYFSNISIDLAPGAVAISSALKSGAQLVKGYGNDLVDYCVRTYRYLNAAKDYERTLYGKRMEEVLNQPGFDPLVATPPSRREVINTIAIRAGLGSEEVPYLALVLEGVVRSSGRWTHGVSTWTQNLWQRPLRYIKKFIASATLVLVGMATVANGRILHWSAWLVGMMILLNWSTISTWLVSIE